MAEVMLFGPSNEQYVASRLGDVGALQWSTGWNNDQPAGCQDASWTMDLPANHMHPALATGRRVEVWDGSVKVYAGTLMEPDRGEPWTLHAQGLSKLADNYLSLDGSGGSTSVPDTAVDQAIGRGLQWTRPSSVSTLAFSSSSSTVNLNRVDGLLDAWCEEHGVRWAVWANGQLSTATDPTQPTWLLAPGAGIMGVSDDNYATDIYARYVSGVDASGNPNAWGTIHVSQSGRWGRREYPLDLTPLGSMSSARATSLANGRLAQLSQRLGWTNSIEASIDDLTHIGGAPARLSQVKAGDMLRIFGILDQDGNLAVDGTVDIVIGKTTYTDGADTITLDPVGLLPRDLLNVLATPDSTSLAFTDRSTS